MEEEIECKHDFVNLPIDGGSYVCQICGKTLINKPKWMKK